MVPLNPPPYFTRALRLGEIVCKGGSPLVDAVRYGIGTVSDSVRKGKVVKRISDGGNDGDPVKGVEEELKSSSLVIDTRAVE